MSGAVIGGVIGAVIGSFIPGVGTAAGWAIGSALGGLLFPETIQGPRLEDLRPQSSEYGRPIPITYGTIALGGSVIWATDLVPVSDGGGKGGPEVENTSYFANFAVAVCEGEVSLGRIWAGPEKRLIWDGATLEGEEAGAMLRWYTGSETQLPDPLIESYMGAGMVPAYRGTAYLVMENFPVAKDGNRIPFLTIEVGGTAEPERLGYVWPHSVWIDDSTIILAHSAAGGGVVIAGQDDPHTFVASHQFQGFTWNLAQTTYDPDRNKLVGFSTAGPMFTLMAMSNGAESQTALDQPTGLVSGLSPRGEDPADAVYHRGLYMFLTLPGGGTHPTLYGVNPDTLATVFVYVYTNVPVTSGHLYLAAPADENAAYVIAVSEETAWKLPIPSLAGSSDQTAISMGAVAPAYSGSNGQLRGLDPTTGYLWTARRDGTGSTQLYISVHDPVTATQLTNTTVTLAYGMVALGIAFAGSKVFVFGQRSFLSDHFVEFNGSTYAYVTEHPGVYHSAAPPKLMAYDPDRNLLMAFRDAYEYGTVAETESGDLNPGSIPFSSWEIGQQDGQLTLTSTTLDQIVLDLSERAGLDASQVDVTALEDDEVQGYAVANQTDVRAAILALAPAYYFDAVESDGKVKYVKRGGGIAAEIDDDELGAYESGSQAPDPLETSRQMDEELPANLNVRYISEPTKYDIATKIAKRLVGNSGNEATIDLPIVMSDTKAQQVAEVNLHGPWVGRLTYRFSLPRKYAYLEPTDVIAVGGYTMRIITIKQTGGRYQVEAVHDDANVYTPHVVVTETVPPPQEVETVSPTLLELM